ncbi:DUF6326 family protein [Flavicella sediminum]|uniref:DUF6326 family protein n=1 Tax=Flavicella sediminum TaxID=2585141 RepID=UPI001122B644|nr:DUF6326 family protein [Flavicella sediminum]
MNVKTKLSTLWIVVLFNLILADILSVFIELVNKNTLDGILGEVTTTMAIAAVVINIPIAMIYFSRTLDFKLNRLLNLIAAVVTILFVVGGGSLLPHYIICASIEVLVLFVIMRTVWKWEV